MVGEESQSLRCCVREISGSTGCQPVRLGSLPRRCVLCRFRFRESVAGKLPATTGWQPVLPSQSVLRRVRRRRFVDRADDCPNDNHLDQAARAAVKNQLPRKWLHGVKAQAHADRRDL